MMLKYMVISVIEGVQNAAFFKSYVDARQHAINVGYSTCGYYQIYKYYEDSKEYECLEMN